MKSAKMIMKHGKTAAFILAAENLTYKDVEELLEKHPRITDKLIEDIIKRENINLLRRFQS